MEEGYCNLLFFFEECCLLDLVIEVVWILDELLGYVGIWLVVKEVGKVFG